MDNSGDSCDFDDFFFPVYYNRAVRLLFFFIVMVSLVFTSFNLYKYENVRFGGGVGGEGFTL